MRVAIIGGGITGLASAIYLADKNISTVIFEADIKCGGLARGFNPGNWKWNLEIFYHHVFTNDSDILSLAKKVGAKVIINNPKTTSFIGGKEIALDSPLSLLKFSKLSLWARIRMGFGLMILKVIPNGLFLEKYKAVNVLPSLLGGEGYGLIWEKLLRAKFGPYADEVNMAWFWSRVAKRTKSLAYFDRGFDGLVDKMEEYLLKKGGEIRLGVGVRSIDPSRDDTGIVMVDVDEYDAVIVTTPAPIAEKLIENLKFPKLNYLWGQTLILELSRKILNSYWANILDKNFPFLVAVEHTNMIDKKVYGGNRLVYLGNYLPEVHKQLSMSREEIIKLYLPYIKKLNKNFDKKNIKKSFLFRMPFAQPVFPLNYSKQIPEVRVAKGVYLANMSMVYPYDRGTNYAVKMGKDVANLIIRDSKTNA